MLYFNTRTWYHKVDGFIIKHNKNSSKDFVEYLFVEMPTELFAQCINFVKYTSCCFQVLQDCIHGLLHVRPY